MYHRARQMRCAAFESREELGGIAGSEITRGWNFCLRVSLFSPPSKGGENTEESSFRWGMNPILFSATLSGRFVRDSKVGDAFEPRKMATERARWILGKRAQRAQRAQKGRGRERERDLACAFIFLVSFSSPRYGRIGVKISLSSLFFGPFFSLRENFFLFFCSFSLQKYSRVFLLLLLLLLLKCNRRKRREDRRSKLLSPPRRKKRLIAEPPWLCSRLPQSRPLRRAPTPT